MNFENDFGRCHVNLTKTRLLLATSARCACLTTDSFLIKQSAQMKVPFPYLPLLRSQLLPALRSIEVLLALEKQSGHLLVIRTGLEHCARPRGLPPPRVVTGLTL